MRAFQLNWNDVELRCQRERLGSSSRISTEAIHSIQFGICSRSDQSDQTVSIECGTSTWTLCSSQLLMGQVCGVGLWSAVCLGNGRRGFWIYAVMGCLTWARYCRTAVAAWLPEMVAPSMLSM